MSCWFTGRFGWWLLCFWYLFCCLYLFGLGCLRVRIALVDSVGSVGVCTLMCAARWFAVCSFCLNCCCWVYVLVVVLFIMFIAAVFV